MNSTQRLVKQAALALAALALLVLSGCDYSILTRGAALAAWSPDGERLAVCINNAASETSELWLVEPAAGSKRLLLSGERSRGLPHLLAPRWSVDGRRLYCLRTVESSEDERRPATVVTIDPASGEHRELSVLHYTGSRSSLLSASDVIVPLAGGALALQDLQDDGTYRLLRFDPATGAGSPFPNLSGSWLGISGSPDGMRLAAARPGPGGSGAVVVVIRHTGERLCGPLDLVQADESKDPQPALGWSPDSRHLALVMDGQPSGPAIDELPVPAHRRGADADEEISGTLILVDTDTSVARIIGRDLFGIMPVFSPQGSHLAWAASARVRDADDELLLEARVTSVADGTSTTASLPGMVVPVAWNADGTRVSCFHGLIDDSGDPGALYAVRFDGTGTAMVSPSQEDRLAAAFSGGGRLAWVSGDGAVQVLDPGSGEQLYNDGMTVTGTLQAGEDHLRQGRPEAALELLAGLDSASLDGEEAARLAAVSHAALRSLERDGEAAAELERACTELAARDDEPDLAFLVLCGELSDFGYRFAAERLVEEQLLTRYPDSPHAVEALWALAALKQSEGDGRSSLRHLARLLRSYPGERSEISRVLLLAALAEAGEDPALVLELAGLVVEANADPADDERMAHRAAAHYTRGLALERSGRPRDARAAYAAALARSSDTHLSDGRQVEDLCWEALLRLARSETPAARR